MTRPAVANGKLEKDGVRRCEVLCKITLLSALSTELEMAKNYTRIKHFYKVIKFRSNFSKYFDISSRIGHPELFFI